MKVVPDKRLVNMINVYANNIYDPDNKSIQTGLVMDLNHSMKQSIEKKMELVGVLRVILIPSSKVAKTCLTCWTHRSPFLED